MSIKTYQDTQNSTDSPVQMSVRAVRSVLLYCQDCSDKTLTTLQRQQSAEAGRLLCDTMVMLMRGDLPSKEQQLLTVIFNKTSEALYTYMNDSTVSLIENERAMIKLLDILKGQKS